MNIGFSLAIERRGAKSRRVQPRPRFGGSNWPPVEMTGRGSPARRREASQARLSPFPLGQVYQSARREDCRRDAVQLGAEQGMVRAGPLLDRNDKAFAQELRQSLAPIVPDGSCLLPDAAYQGWKVGFKAVASPSSEFFQEVAGPIRAIHLQTVAEDGARGIRSKRFDQAVADGLEIILHRDAIIVVED